MDYVMLQNRRTKSGGGFTDWYDYGHSDFDKAGRLIGMFPDFYRAIDPATREPLAAVEAAPAITRDDALAALDLLTRYIQSL